MSARKNNPESSIETSTTRIRFGKDENVGRSEDGPLLIGQGQFTDDISLLGQAYAAFVRATVAHGAIRAVNISHALNRPGVIAVITGRDLAGDNIGAIPPVVVFPGRLSGPEFHVNAPVQLFLQRQIHALSDRLR